MKNFYKKEITYDKLFFLFIISSMAGVVIEGAFCLLTKGQWENHVVSVFGPFNILYGLGAVLLYVGAVMLNRRHIAVKTFTLMTAATILELLGGLLLKYVFGMRAWNYENSFWNYKGIICFGFSLIWGMGAYLFCIFHSHINAMLSWFKGKLCHRICVLSGMLLIIDLYLTSVTIFRWSERHYGIDANSQFDTYIDNAAPNEWMQSRFMEWEFLDEVDLK